MADNTRCDLTDLLAVQCSHCLGQDRRPVTRHERGQSIESRYGGRCACCGDHYKPDTQITFTSEGWTLTDHTEPS